MAHIDLHVHPFLGWNGLGDVADAMERKCLDIVALSALDDSIFPFVKFETKIKFNDYMMDKRGIVFPPQRYFLNAREYNTREGLHLLTIGYSMDSANPDTEIRNIIDKALKNDALVLLDHPFVDNGKTKAAGHISDELEEELIGLCKEYQGLIAVEWNSYYRNDVRKVLKRVLNRFGVETRYSDVNEKAEELAKLYDFPLLAVTDLHARRKGHMRYMGTSRIITDIEGETPEDVFYSMKKNIFEGNYENIKREVSLAHLVDAFCIPIIVERFFEKPRA